MNDPMEFAVKLALQTGDLLQKYYNPTGIHASMKPDQTVVTEADLAADKFITQQIKQNFPHDGILSEESSHFLENSQSPTWIIDPLDGTTNFSLGLSIWGVSIARLRNGYPELGALYFPRLNELYTTRRGSGAYLNNNPISTHAPDPAQPMSFFACCSRSFRSFNISIPYKTRIMGSSTYTISMVARGTALLGLDVTPKIWDLAAAWLLVEEAGGIMSVFEGTPAFPISPNIDYSTTSYTILAAATPKLLEMGRSKIQRK
jgi:myo-inositol-1(or 4)-monophosphatase